MLIRSSYSKEASSRSKTIRLLQGTQNELPLEQESRQILFTLVVDDFGVSFEDKADAEHLEAALKKTIQ